ncbi:MAG: hypothetical protein ACM3W8_00505 [Sideroxydans sp.]|nr:hypothetical protein [Sideroxyarcus sp.]
MTGRNRPIKDSLGLYEDIISTASLGGFVTKKAQLFVWASAALGSISLWIIFIHFAPTEWLYRAKFQEAQVMIERVERYKKTHGVYPPDSAAAELDEKMEGPYYSLQKDGQYTINIAGGNCFFCNQVYSSENKRWVETD